MAAISAREGLDELCRRFLNGDDSSVIQFEVKVRPLVMRIARKYAWDLVEDQRAEVMQEMMLLLLQLKGSGFDTARGSAVTFVGMVARRAARDVSAQYAPAGRQTRPPSKRDFAALEEFQAKSHVEPLEALAEDRVPVAADFAPIVETQLDAAFILRVAPAPVAYGLRRMHYDDVSMEQAASEMHLSRFILNRMIVRFRESVAA
jgi:hypothetical protein